MSAEPPSTQATNGAKQIEDLVPAAADAPTVSGNEGVSVSRVCADLGRSLDVNEEPDPVEMDDGTVSQMRNVKLCFPADTMVSPLSVGWRGAVN